MSTRLAQPTRERLRGRLDTEWSRLWALLETLPPDRLLAPGAVGEWSVKDLVGHIASWEEEAIRDIQQYVRYGWRTRYGGQTGIDRFNRAEAQKRRPLTWAQVRRQSTRTHGRVIGVLESLPEEHLQLRGLARRLLLDTAWHYREHRQDLEP